MSVNREKYSNRPEDVLHPRYPGNGIAAFRVGDIPSPLRSDQRVEYEFRVKHRPRKRNRAHSEVWCWRANEHLGVEADIPLVVQFIFRMLLRRAMVIIRNPTGPTITGA